MRILGTIIRTLIVDVLSRQTEGSNGDVIGPEFIGCNPGGGTVNLSFSATFSQPSTTYKSLIPSSPW